MNVEKMDVKKIKKVSTIDESKKILLELTNIVNSGWMNDDRVKTNTEENVSFFWLIINVFPKKNPESSNNKNCGWEMIVD